MPDQYASAPHYQEMARQRAETFHPGPMGLPEGATAAIIPAAMQANWDAYWASYVHLQIAPTGSGGALVRTGPDDAEYTFPGRKPVYLHRGSNLNALANLDPAIAAEWRKEFGFVPVPLA